MFGKSKQRFRAPRISTVIGSGTAVHGDIHFVDGLHVDGVIRGDVISDPQDPGATLTLSELGTIEGNVRVGNVMLNGTVVGDVIASNRVELAPKARITGTLTYALLEMSMGAEINGKLIHAGQEPKKLEFDGNKQPSAKPAAPEGTRPPPAKPAVSEGHKQPPAKPVVPEGKKQPPAASPATESDKQPPPKSGGPEAVKQGQAKPAATEKSQ